MRRVRCHQLWRSRRPGGVEAPELTSAASSVSTVLSLAGIWLAYAMYVTGQISPKAMGRRFALLYDLFYHKWYVDEIYDALIVRPLMPSSALLWKWVDAGFIDGIVNGIAYAHRRHLAAPARVQTGVVSNYALAIVLGTVVIVGVYLVFGPQFLGK